MAHAETFHGYGAEQGEAFLRDAIAGYYAKRDLKIDPEDIFISDGAKSDLGNLCDLFARTTPCCCRIRSIRCIMIPASCPDGV